jgi:hypothetical protein
MGLFEKLSAESLKAAALTVKATIGSGASSIADTANTIGAKAVEMTSSATDAVRNYDYDDAKKTALEKTAQFRADVLDLQGKAIDAAKNFDFDETKDSLISFSKNSADKLTKYMRGTFEVDKSTFNIVQDIRKRLPVPANSMDEIYDQCRNEAVRRAIAAFMLGDILDKQSEAKYGKLTSTFDEYRTSEAKQYIGVANENYKGMKPAEGEIVINTYNTSETILHSRETGHKVAVEHVTARNAIFQNRLLAAGLTDEQLGDVMNDPRNLAHINRSVNSQKSDLDFDTWLNKFGVQDPNDSDKVTITIKRTGETHVISRKDVAKAAQKSKEAVREGQIQAVKEIGKTVTMTGATMAAQQVVGLIIVETIDIFMDELKRVKLVSSDGMIEELKASKTRISEALSKRFEDRDIWARAKTLGLEAGVAGALSVIPQILISLILKMPAFVFALIRESTLSVVRCVRIVASNDENKLESLQVVMLGAASAVVGIYVHRVISQGISAVPLPNQFNGAVSGILSGMLITAIPLAAIYTFDQNKATLILRLKGDGKGIEGNASVT